MRGPPDAATDTASLIVSWTPDPNLPTGEQYVVAIRNRSSTTANWTLSVPVGPQLQWWIIA